MIQLKTEESDERMRHEFFQLEMNWRILMDG
jgi:hypothetical protein